MREDSTYEVFSATDPGCDLSGWGNPDTLLQTIPFPQALSQRVRGTERVAGTRFIESPSGDGFRTAQGFHLGSKGLDF
jgi:hypothetical protein